MAMTKLEETIAVANNNYVQWKKAEAQRNELLAFTRMVAAGHITHQGCKETAELLITKLGAV